MSKPGKDAQAQDALRAFLREIEGHPGYLGGSVTKNSSASELRHLPGELFVLTFDFESTDTVRAFRKAIGDGVNPITQDDKATKSKDQGAVMFDEQASGELDYEKGGGVFAQLMHVHAYLVDEYSSSSA
ncbi:hypothetical protein ACFV9C_43105 [Kribbella sp. NPDC059898]|uniref:hypothetical protein n=1 Tax=Kribbella sp. NPDC059898 TaxID=3346995 RepID=UPI0036502756